MQPHISLSGIKRAEAVKMQNNRGDELKRANVFFFFSFFIFNYLRVPFVYKTIPKETHKRFGCSHVVITLKREWMQAIL